MVKFGRPPSHSAIVHRRRSAPLNQRCMSLKSYRELRVWREGMGLAKDVYLLTRAFPSEERYGITAQLRRAVVAVPSDIAEGNIRSSRRDYLRFIDMARGTVAEIETQLILAIELHMGEREVIEQALTRTELLGRQLTALRCSLTNGLPRPSPQPPTPRPEQYAVPTPPRTAPSHPAPPTSPPA